MFELTGILNTPPYSLPHAEKAELYTQALSDLTDHHAAHCPPYRRILDVLGYQIGKKAVAEIPFIPVRLFKEYELLSVEKAQVVKTMTSSGTGGQVSKIFLDRETAVNQTKVLTKIASSFLGTKRLPMLVIDTSAVVKDRRLFSARGAGILGFSMLGSDVTYALDEQMHFNEEAVRAFLERHSGGPVLLFGFTFMIWECFIEPLRQAGIRLPLDNGILIHGGGWKKLAEKSVGNEAFKQAVNAVSGISRVHNYYGMVEQTGSIFMECECGHLHTSIFSDVLIRDHRDFSVKKPGEQGLIQLVSLLPLSYPGHSILSEDLGAVLGEDDCPCGRLGKYFRVDGRIKHAEIRGCSDTYGSPAR